MGIQVRATPARWIATVGEELVSTEVRDFMARAVPSLHEFVARHPGLRSHEITADEPMIALYHGVIAPTRRVLVEVGFVLAKPAASSGMVKVRQEQGHDEAVIPIIRDDVSHSRLARYYRELAAWVYAHGTPHISCPPREIYTASLDDAAPQDVVGEVAYPFGLMTR